MFRPHYGICTCHGLERLIVVKSGLCKQGNDEKKHKGDRSGKEKPAGISTRKRISDSGEAKRYRQRNKPIKNKRDDNGVSPPARLVVRKLIPKRSEKRRKQEVAYQALRKVYLATHPHCEANIHGVCSGEPAHEIHHTYSGKDREKYFLDSSTWKAVERSCHDWIHLNPIEARELGLLK